MQEIDYLYRKSIRFTIEQRKESNWSGRFGGGFNWELGLEIGHTCMIINLLVLSIRIDIGGIR